ncbi:hypothetical protein LKL35_05055 [Streptomyces sp. ET3-23]|uniref:VC0807 family protein n=1 Tax=Streptomyces sp. ET3-23 TaxID=2885643 RepID=UPI001D12867E|nr:VC0807 family protein [Streptomyces sp. ET3-23]MCC2274809.1 hypothetical protein [Streptomyces sp. ET3-23]
MVETKTGTKTAGTKATPVPALLLDVCVPLAGYYGLRAAGAGQWWALALSGTAPLLHTVWTLVRTRRIDSIGLFVLVTMALSAVMPLLTGSPRLLLARESWSTAAFGLWIVGSLLGRRPFLLDVTLKFLRGAAARRWEESWANDPRFRRRLRLVTVLWGGAFLLDAAARVVMAYTLPVDVVPVAGAVLLVVLLIVVRQGSVRVLRHRGTR